MSPRFLDGAIFLETSLLFGQQGQNQGGLLQLFEVFWFPIVMMILFYFLIVIRPEQQNRGKRQDMLKNLKKNDSVVTVGGILGIVTNVSQDGSEVTIRVDDNSNTRIRVRKTSIEAVTNNDKHEKDNKVETTKDKS